MDYAQLEVIGLAVLSSCPDLKADLKSGIDIHSRNAADLFGGVYGGVKYAVDTPTHEAHDLWTKRTIVYRKNWLQNL